MRKVIILAASIHQLSVIRAAKLMGFFTITIDNNPENPGHQLADKSYIVSTTDIDGIMTIALDEKVDGIIAAGTDVAVYTASTINEEIGIFTCPSNAAKILTDKSLFRLWQQQVGMSSPRTFIINHPNDIETVCEEISLNKWSDHRWVVKPARSSGSKGIHVLEPEGDLIDLVRIASGFDVEGKVIIEEYLHGIQGSIEGIFENNQIIWSMITRRFVAPLPYVATRGHMTPYFDQVIEYELHLACVYILEKFGIKRTSFNADFVWTDRGIYILEISPRIGGNSLSELAFFFCGISLPEMTLQIAMDMPLGSVHYSNTRGVALLLLGVENDGFLSWNEIGFNRLQNLPWLKHLEIHRSRGEWVNAFHHGRHQVGVVIFDIDSYSDFEIKKNIIECELGMVNLHEL